MQISVIKRLKFTDSDLQCEPLHGWGFRRGGYQCRCRPGFRLPTVVRRPYLGEIVERATSEQYYNGFDCSKIGCTAKNSVNIKNEKNFRTRSMIISNTTFFY